MKPMTAEQYWAYKAFTQDDATEKALSGSEVFMSYRAAEMTRESELQKINDRIAEQDKSATLAEFEEFEKKIASSPELKAKFRKIKEYLQVNPEAAAKTDPNFINGLNMMDLED